MDTTNETDIEDNIWGNTLLPAVMDAIGIDGDAKGVRLHFEYGEYATATIMRDDQDDAVHILPLFGTNVISEALGAPKYLQAITIDIEKDMFAICHCRYVPLDASIDGIVAALRKRD